MRFFASIGKPAGFYPTRTAAFFILRRKLEDIWLFTRALTWTG
jgi:hypothetical protein